MVPGADDDIAIFVRTLLQASALQYIADMMPASSMRSLSHTARGTRAATFGSSKPSTASGTSPHLRLTATSASTAAALNQGVDISGTMFVCSPMPSGNGTPRAFATATSSLSEKCTNKVPFMPAAR